MSFKPEVQTDNSGQWYDNALRFETLAEAEANAADLYARWTLCRAYRAVESPDPVNYRWHPTRGLIGLDDKTAQDPTP